MDKKLIDAKKLSGWIEKKSPSFFGGYQRRFFSVSDGKYLVYVEKLGEAPKGVIPLDGAKVVVDSDKLIFKIILPDREFILRTPNADERTKWVTLLQVLIDEIAMAKKSSIKNVEDEKKRISESNTNASKKNWKIENLDKEAYKDLQKMGVVANLDNELSKKCLQIKGISKHFTTIPKEKLEPRMHYSFLRHKSKSENTKRWFFIISSRPLNEFGYDNDDNFLEDKVLPSFLMFDTLFFFECENEKDSSLEKGRYALKDCFAIEKVDDQDDYTIIMDLGDTKVELITNVRGERDIWFDALKYSRMTAKEISNSITKKPRNLNKFMNIIEKEGIEMITNICVDEKNGLEKRYKENISKDMMESIIRDTQEILFRTLDSCILAQPPRKDIMKVYVETLDEFVLDNLYKIWKNNYQDLSSLEIVDLGLMLIKYEEDLIQFRVKDPNFLLNGREFLKIYAKKTFYSLRDIIENILKSEREIKAVNGSGNILITNGPTDLFKLIYNTLELVKGKNNKILFEKLIRVFKEIIIEYLIAIDYLVQRIDLDIDKEFLMAVSNNSISISAHLENLVKDLESLNLFNQTELEDLFCIKDFNYSLGLISSNCHVRIVEELFEIMIETFVDDFFQLDIKELCTICILIYTRLADFMHETNKIKLWTQVLNIFTVHYLKSLLTTANNNLKDIEVLKGKLISDKKIFFDSFREPVGENLTEETLRIIDEFLNFINSDLDMIGINCKALRDFCGPSFTLTTAKALINLRIDFDRQTKEEAISSCKLMLDNISKEGKDENKEMKHNPLFDLIQKGLKLREIEEREKRNSYGQQVQFFTKKKNVALSSFLKLETEKDKNENKPEEKKEFVFIKKRADTIIEHDIIISGYMNKKSNSIWQSRYFTLKNGMLFWYMDNKSIEKQNSFKIIDIQKIHAHKEKKFEIIENDKSYKFECDNNENRDEWINAIKKEMLKLKVTETKKNIEIIYEVKLKKRVINDLFNLPNIFMDKLYMKNKVEKALLEEKNFVIKPIKLSEEQKGCILELNKSLINKKASFDEEKPRLDKSMISENTSIKIGPIPSLAIQLLEENKTKRKKRNPFTACINWFSGLCKKNGA